ncbi:flavin reductase family protein [Paraburkholderia fungorum]
MDSPARSTQIVDSFDFKQSMRSVVASVNVITCRYEDTHYGLTATAFCSVSADPPTVLICVNGNASACERIRLSGRFCVNVLTSGMEELAAAFAGKIAPEHRFASGRWRELESGNLMAEGCAAAFDCEVKSVMQEGSHWILVGTVRQCEYAPAPALAYANGAFGRFAASVATD